jgi:hypothetical protein
MQYGVGDSGGEAIAVEADNVQIRRCHEAAVFKNSIRTNERLVVGLASRRAGC